MKSGSTAVTTVRFAPASGTVFATVTISGASCPIATTYKVTAIAYGEAVNATGTFAEQQTVHFSETVQKDAGGTPSTLFVGGQEAFISGNVSNLLNPKGFFAVKKT